MTETELLADIIYWEDLKSSLSIMPSEDGQTMHVFSMTNDTWGEGKTFEEALKDYVKKGKIKRFTDEET